MNKKGLSKIRHHLGKTQGQLAQLLGVSTKAINIDHFRDYSWKSALKRAKVPYRKPYTMRHTFAAWMLLVGKAPGEVARLMGHSSKQMVYEVYGKFVEGLESEKKDIEGYLGIRDGQPFQGDEGHE